MKFDTKTTVGSFLALFALLAVGTVMSPMSTGTVAMVSVGLLIFGLLSLAIGVKHGEHRASR